MRTGQGYHDITNEVENAGVRVLSVSCPVRVVRFSLFLRYVKSITCVLSIACVLQIHPPATNLRNPYAVTVDFESKAFIKFTMVCNTVSSPTEVLIMA
jgi:hypothetical protein